MSFISYANYNMFEKKYLAHIQDHLILAKKFVHQPRYTWLEKVFCKNIIKEQKLLRQEIQKLNSKPVKWNRFVDVGSKRRKRRKTNANKS